MKSLALMVILTIGAASHADGYCVAYCSEQAVSKDGSVSSINQPFAYPQVRAFAATPALALTDISKQCDKMAKARYSDFKHEPSSDSYVNYSFELATSFEYMHGVFNVKEACVSDMMDNLKKNFDR